MSKVLIVDDKGENIYLLQSLMDTINLETIAAGNGKEALELAKKNVPDIIISDILMPVMDGYTFCRECK
ncbi:MAG: response regulator, partial [Bacteroidota bacterium]